MKIKYDKDVWFFVDGYFKQKPMYKEFFIETWIEFMKNGNWAIVPREVRVGIIEHLLSNYSTTYVFVYNVFFIGTMINKSKDELELFQDEIDSAKEAMDIIPQGLMDTFYGN